MGKIEVHGSTLAAVSTDPRLRILPRVNPPQSPREFRPLRPYRGTPINAFEQIAQLPRRQAHWLALRYGPDEPSALQLLGKQTRPLAVMPDQLDQIPALAPEHKHLPSGGSCFSTSCTMSANPTKPWRMSVTPATGHTRTPAETGIIWSRVLQLRAGARYQTKDGHRGIW